jgi:hypothetical protein
MLGSIPIVYTVTAHFTASPESYCKTVRLFICQLPRRVVMAVDLDPVEISSGSYPVPQEEGEVAESLKILQMREEKITPLFAVLQQCLNMNPPGGREALNKVVSILELTPLETIVMAEGLIRYKKTRKSRSTVILNEGL